MSSSHKGQPLRRRDRGFAVYDDADAAPDPVYRTNPSTGQIEQRGFDGWYHPLAYFDAPASHERVRRACRETRGLVGVLRPFELWACTMRVLVAGL